MAIKSAGIDGCVQEFGLRPASRVLWSVCSGCGAMLTLLYNCQFFAGNAWWAASVWEWSGGFCGAVVSGMSRCGCGCGCGWGIREEWPWHAATLQYSFGRIIDIDEQCCRADATTTMSKSRDWEGIGKLNTARKCIDILIGVGLCHLCDIGFVYN